ncbi:hypothetical protein B0A49_01786 [Cryomyces minteri]|uniref:Uncharacterized protein n=1 Tax=Cryomyces minteri TaxID=331657 RepID=A0A4U0XQ96_9PEZI|nr:hypothetical protein B0A49_01786 [Cryomyces minteri]
MCRDIITIFEDCGHDMEYTQYCTNAPTETEKCEVEEPEKETHEPGLCGDCHQQVAVERQRREEAEQEELLQRALRESAEEFDNRPQEAPLLPEEDKEYQANLERIRQESLATHAAEKERKIATTADHVADDDEEALNRVLEESKRTAAKKIEKAPERRPGYVADDDEEELERIKELSMQQHEQELEERAKWHVPLYTNDEDIMQELNEFLAREKAERAAIIGGPSSSAPICPERLRPDLWRFSSQAAPNPNSKKPIGAQSPVLLGDPALADEVTDGHNQQGNDFGARFQPLSAGGQPREPSLPEVSGADKPDEDELLKVQAQARAVWRDQQARKGKGANASSLRLGVSLNEESDMQESTLASRGRKAQVATETTAPSLAQISERKPSPAIDPETAQSQFAEEEALRAHGMRDIDRRAGSHNRDNSTVDHDENDYREHDLAEHSDGHCSDYGDSHDGVQGAAPQTAADPYLPGFATAVYLPLPSYTQDAEAAAARGDARQLGLPPVSVSRGGRGPAENLDHARGRR